MSPEQQFLRFREAVDVVALAAVFDALAPELLVIAAHLVGREAEDLVQATFLDAIEKADRWDATRPLLPWLIGILVNHARQDRRRRGRTLAEGRLLSRAEPSPLDALAQPVVEYVVEARPAGLSDSLAWASATNVRPGSSELVLRANTREEDAGWFTGTLLASNGAPPRHPAKAWVIPDGHRQGTHMPIVIDAAGTFRIGPLPAGRYSLGIRVQDEAAVDLGSHDLAPRQEVHLATAQLQASGVLEVRFTTPRGGVVTPSEATVLDRAGNGGTLLPHGQDGLFRSHPLPAGIYRLSAWGEDFVLAPAQVVVVADRTTASEVPVRPATRVAFAFAWPPGPGRHESAPAVVELRVYDAAGVEVAAARMSFDATSASTWRRGLSAGHYRFTARVGNSGDSETGAFTVREDAAEQTVEVVLPANPASK